MEKGRGEDKEWGRGRVRVKRGEGKRGEETDRPFAMVVLHLYREAAPGPPALAVETKVVSPSVPFCRSAATTFPFPYNDPPISQKKSPTHLLNVFVCLMQSKGRTWPLM